MKNLLSILIISTLVFSCRQQTTTENETTETANPDLKNSIWVNDRYLTTLEETRSPLKASIYADTVMISFDATADTANIVWNFHEASLHLVKKGDKVELFNAYEAKPKPEFDITFENGKLRLSRSLFQKIDTIGFVEKKFWLGSYGYNDEVITLKTDEILEGSDEWSGYRVWVDYVTAQTDIDLIDLQKKGSNKWTTYGYRFEGNEIIFYNFRWVEDGVVGKASKEAFRWKRK